MTFNTGSVTGLGYLLECRHRIRGDLLRWEGLGAQSVPQVTPFRFIFHWKTVALYMYQKDFLPLPFWTIVFFMSESSRSMKSQCNITSKAVAPRVKWRSRFKRAPSGLGENAFQHRWKFTIDIIFYVPNASLAQNSSGSGQRKTCKYYVKTPEKAIFNWYSNGQVDIVLIKNGLQSIFSLIESKSVWKSWKKSEMQLFANTKLVQNKYCTYIWPPKEVANWGKGEMPLCSRTN